MRFLQRRCEGVIHSTSFGRGWGGLLFMPTNLSGCGSAGQMELFAAKIKKIVAAKFSIPFREDLSALRLGPIDSLCSSKRRTLARLAVVRSRSRCSLKGNHGGESERRMIPFSGITLLQVRHHVRSHRRLECPVLFILPTYKCGTAAAGRARFLRAAHE